MNVHRNIVAVLLASGALFTQLSGCGGGGGSSGNTAGAASNTASGVASKGLLNGSTVCAYAISAGAKGSQLGNCATTSSVGAFTVDLGGYTGPVLFEASSGSYIDEASGSSVALATPLHGFLANAGSGANTAAISALTELAYELAGASSGGLTATNLQSAAISVQTNFGVGDIVATQPVDALSLPTDATNDQKAYALALATVSQYQSATSGTLGGTLQGIEACLAAASSCGTLSADLAAALSTFQSGHGGYTGMGLPSGSFGGSGSGGDGGGTPAVSSFTPGSGAVGSTVTVSGTNLGNFTPAPMVKFGTTVATVSSATSTSIVVTVPSGLSAGSTAITLSNFDGTGVVPVGSYTVTAAPGGSGGSACLIDGSTASYPNAKVCYDALPAPFTCDAAGMASSAAGYLAVAGASSYTYSSVSSCPSGVTSGTVFYTVSGAGVASTLAGTAIAATTYAGPETDGAAASARFYFAASSTVTDSGIASDGSKLYVVDSGHCSVRAVDMTSGAVSTLAGNAAGVDHLYGFPCGHGDGTGTTGVYFSAPVGITIDPGNSNLYVSDGRYLRKIVIATGQVSTLINFTFTNAGTGVTDWFKGAAGITTDGTSLYMVDRQLSGTPAIVRKIDLATNAVSNLNLTGSALPSTSQAITYDNGMLYVSGGSVVSKIVLSTNVVTQLAGNTSVAAISRDGTGAAATFTLNNEGIVSDGTYLYVNDSSLVRKIDISSGLVSTFAGSTAGFADGTGTAAKFNKLGGLVRVGGVLYAPDNLSAIRKIQ